MSTPATNAETAWMDFTRSRLAENYLATARLVDLDSEILAIEKSLRLAKELRNRKAPISTLPDDVILQIFLDVREDHVDSPEVWMQVCTHTCRRFRSVSLDSRSLWAKLSNRRDPSRKLIKSLVARSGTYPTTVELHMDNSISKQKAALLALDFEFSHVETLTISLQHGPSAVTVDGLFRMPMLMLKHLKVHVDGNQLTRSIPSPHCIPRDLESLHVTRTTFSWSSAIYDNLVELSIRKLATNSKPTREECQDAFSRMHRIESITLTETSLFDPPTASSIQLPSSLKHFAIVEPRNSLEVESMVYIPPLSLQKLNLESFCDNDSPTTKQKQVSEVFQHWRCMWSQPRSFMGLTLVTYASGETSFNVTILNGPSEDSSSPPSKPSKVTYIQSKATRVRIDKSLAEVCPTLFGLRLTARSCREYGVTGRDVWHSLFKRLGKLKTLVLSECSLTIILPILVETPTYCPELGFFEIIADHLDAAARGAMGSACEPVGNGHVVWLSQWLEKREKEGLSGPRTLRLTPFLQDGLDQISGSNS